jgi:cytochrome c
MAFTSNAAVTLAMFCALAMPVLAEDGEKLINDSDCSSCHAVDHEVVGPSYSSIAKRYVGQAEAPDKLSAKIRDGGSGMTAHPKLSDAQRRDMATWVLAQKDSMPSSSAGDAETYFYKLKDGSTATLDFPLFLDGSGPKVTKDVFHGYQLYNSYCYRCHGTDASGGQLAPDLRHSLTVGIKQRDFLSVAMSGKEEKGMPAWAGFLTEQDVVDIFRYVTGRRLDLIPSGRPPSAQD